MSTDLIKRAEELSTAIVAVQHSLTSKAIQIIGFDKLTALKQRHDEFAKAMRKYETSLNDNQH